MIQDKYYVIDAHCHIYPEKIARAAVNGTDNFYSITSAHTGVTSELYEIGASYGIDRFVVQSVATTPHQVSSINRFIAAEVEKSNGKLIGVGTLHPDSENIENDVDELIALGLHGVKLHPDIQRFKIDDYRCLKIYDLCEQKELPILMHTGDFRYDYSNPNRLMPILDIYKKLTIVGAHFGGWSIWEEAAATYAGIENFYVDCSSSFYALSPETAIRLIRTYGADKVLFATDYPMWDAGPELDYIMKLGLTDDEYVKILSENAKKVYNID